MGGILTGDVRGQGRGGTLTGGGVVVAAVSVQLVYVHVRLVSVH